jgi:tetratricopeptide (TPR) repeat protein
MKYLFILLPFFANTIKGQNSLSFDKKYIECENKWVSFPIGKDSSYMFGLIYFDTQAGLTLHYEGTFKIENSGKFASTKVENSMIIKRLSPSRTKVAIIPHEKFKELQISERPDWLKIYIRDSTSVERQYKLGFCYNAWDECKTALVYLEKVQKIEPKYKGLENELAYSYNALGNFEKASTILESAIKTNPEDCYLLKELSFAQIQLKKIDKAEETCKKAIVVCTDKQMKSEIAYNLIFQYYERKDKIKFGKLAEEIRKFATNGDRVLVNLTKMEAELSK